MQLIQQQCCTGISFEGISVLVNKFEEIVNETERAGGFFKQLEAKCC